VAGLKGFFEGRRAIHQIGRFPKEKTKNDVSTT
jgi:hypothetical protein